MINIDLEIIQKILFRILCYQLALLIPLKLLTYLLPYWRYNDIQKRKEHKNEIKK